MPLSLSLLFFLFFRHPTKQHCVGVCLSFSSSSSSSSFSFVCFSLSIDSFACDTPSEIFDSAMTSSLSDQTSVLNGPTNHATPKFLLSLLSGIPTTFVMLCMFERAKQFVCLFVFFWFIEPVLCRCGSFFSPGLIISFLFLCTLLLLL
jgi:hypothetical protein